MKKWLTRHESYVRQASWLVIGTLLILFWMAAYRQIERKALKIVRENARQEKIYILSAPDWEWNGKPGSLPPIKGFESPGNQK